MKKYINKAIRFFCWTSASIITFIFLFEICYRLLPKSYFGIDYKELYSDTGLNEGGFLKPNTDTLVVSGYGEQVRWITNSKGFRNTSEFSKKKPPNIFRILSLGDSFTAGARIGQSETFSFLLEQKLNENKDSLTYEVIIANIEDPVQGLAYVNKYGLAYEPDIILLGVTLGNDLTQTYINLNQNGRFQLNKNKLSQNTNYSQQQLNNLLEERIPNSACNYTHDFNDATEKLISLKLLKLFLKITNDGESIFSSRGKAYPYLHDLSHGLGLFLKAAPNSIETTYQKFEAVLSAYQNISIANNTRLIVCIFPQRYQISPSDWKHTIKDYDLNESYFDLNIANNRINSFCSKNNIETIDPTQKMKEESSKNKQNLYFPLGDMHWNKNGNRIVSESIYDYLGKNQ